MPYDLTSGLWPDSHEHFFSERSFAPQLQSGPHCVSTALAILTGTGPEYFQDKMNTQDPLSWSDALHAFGMKLAYCPADVRKLQFYMPDLIRLDDLFTLSYYTAYDPDNILADPDEGGWVCGSHIVIMHRDKILDPLLGSITPAINHECLTHYTKRIFRVVPKDYPRGL